jgi:deoxyribodipyrimidine photo-lyase
MTRVRDLNFAAFRNSAHYILYWASANRRLDSNHALAYAVDLANQHNLPVLMYEALTCEHPWANDRFHTFVLEGVPDNARRAKELGIGYCFYLRKTLADPNHVLYRLAEHAGAVVTDDYPSYIPNLYNVSVPQKIGVPYYAVEASCIAPTTGKQEYAAYTIRPRIHKVLEEHMVPVPPLRVKKKYSEAPPLFHTEVTREKIPSLIADSEIDHSVPASSKYKGGRVEALKRMQDFLEHNLRRYAMYSSKPSEKATSRLSAYLHFGHISALEIALAAREYAEQHKLMAAEFLEELIVRRELAFNFARYGPDPTKLAALPEWARKTLEKHAKDKRDTVYSRDQFDRALTHDPLWNACQQELLREGSIHGYYRMYWGKKIIEWSATHQEALDTMIYLNDRYALDGRDPNTYTNILWCFGLHDRPWSERSIFGMVRYMSLEGMKRKTNVDAYIQSQQAPERTLFDEV